MGLCNSTAQNCIHALKQIGVDAYPLAIGITAQNPVYIDKTFGHYICVVNVQNELYIYDMPQMEFVKPAKKKKGGFRYVQDFQPRFIKLTTQNIMDNYKVSEEVAEKNRNNILDYECNQYPFSEYVKQTLMINQSYSQPQVQF